MLRFAMLDQHYQSACSLENKTNMFFDACEVCATKPLLSNLDFFAESQEKMSSFDDDLSSDIEVLVEDLVLEPCPI